MERSVSGRGVGGRGVSSVSGNSVSGFLGQHVLYPQLRVKLFSATNHGVNTCIHVSTFLIINPPPRTELLPAITGVDVSVGTVKFPDSPPDAVITIVTHL